jgi:hypothetical protein
MRPTGSLTVRDVKASAMFGVQQLGKFWYLLVMLHGLLQYMCAVHESYHKVPRQVHT